jgi:VWFA-related protein
VRHSSSPFAFLVSLRQTMSSPASRLHVALAAFASAIVVAALTSVAAQQPAPATPQEPPSAQDQPPRFRTEANYVRVDVYPTANGQAVRDLRAEDFELFENGVKQQVQAFEHVVVTPAGPQSLRVEAGSVRRAEQMAANPRNRVFVFFLDIPHVAVEGSHRIKEPVIRLMDRVLGPDDLVAVMTPEMVASQVTFGRKTEVIAAMLRENWVWGHRHSIRPMDQRELEYERCFPHRAQQGVVAAMIARRRERMVLDALRDLVTYLGTVREERKAIIPISEGWVLYRPDPGLETLVVVDKRTGATEPLPGLDPIGVDQHGKLRAGAARTREGDTVTQTECDRERMHLANIDNDDYFRDIMALANRNNASFYPIDPRGLAAFDYPLGPEAPPSLQVDQASLRTRIETLRTLADNTDGLAVVNTNDLDRGLRRIADDLTSYYLLGYYSTNTKLDGAFRRITVRVKRPGVDVRARRGYRAATIEEVNAGRAAAAAPVPDAARTTSAALATLGRIRDDQRFVLHAVPVRAASGAITSVWVAGEVIVPMQEVASGAEASIDLSGGATGTAKASIKTGERAFLVNLPVETTAGAIDVRARVATQTATEPLAANARIEGSTVQPLLFRRGPATGNRVHPAATFRFSRTERLRLELPIAADATLGSARLLDRNAQPLPLPVQIADKTGDDGQRWLTADATLSALGAGDYVVEVSYGAGGTEQKVLTAIRVTR